MNWYLFTGSNPTDPAHYTRVASQPNCIGSCVICAIRASDDGNGNPVISVSLLQEMILALSNKTNSANVMLKD
ncbi:hypothetical protein HCX49_03755 [Sphingobacterium kitahiroshimense]|uniref:hypothetical protein n=1 Tax=Sphingobacterium sp. B16(2022) TaxID=2914044 RepID=UPI00143BB182|nr:hypothetical protein [Sphingobacterium sp. B16(2022)]NJI72311.1 hypothetical protein [Sphingobacterium sp. B16(2022)]